MSPAGLFGDNRFYYFLFLQFSKLIIECIYTYSSKYRQVGEKYKIFDERLHREHSSDRREVSRYGGHKSQEFCEHRKLDLQHDASSQNSSNFSGGINKLHHNHPHDRREGGSRKLQHDHLLERRVGSSDLHHVHPHERREGNSSSVYHEYPRERIESRNGLRESEYERNLSGGERAKARDWGQGRERGSERDSKRDYEQVSKRARSRSSERREVEVTRSHNSYNSHSSHNNPESLRHDADFRSNGITAEKWTKLTDAEKEAQYEAAIAEASLHMSRQRSRSPATGDDDEGEGEEDARRIRRERFGDRGDDGAVVPSSLAGRAPDFQAAERLAGDAAGLISRCCCCSSTVDASVLFTIIRQYK